MPQALHFPFPVSQLPVQSTSVCLKVTLPASITVCVGLSRPHVDGAASHIVMFTEAFPPIFSEKRRTIEMMCLYIHS